MSRCLPLFRGYTIDVRLKEFRKADPSKGLEFIAFDSTEGEELLTGYIKTIKAKDKDALQKLLGIWI